MLPYAEDRTAVFPLPEDVDVYVVSTRKCGLCTELHSTLSRLGYGPDYLYPEERALPFRDASVFPRIALGINGRICPRTTIPFDMQDAQEIRSSIFSLYVQCIAEDAKGVETRPTIAIQPDPL